jgi:Tol biopolymer transport system component
MLVNPDGSGLRRVTQTNSFNMRPSWSPDGKFLVATSYGRIVVVDVATGEEIPIPITAVNKSFAFPAWRP